jgi:nicotinic acid phosphoribosyltransferase
MLTIQEFLSGTPKVPRPLLADAYTIGTVHASSEEQDRAVFHVVPRRGLSKILSFAKDDRLIFAGLIRILRDILATPVTLAELEETDKFLATFHAGGTPYTWNKEVWHRIVTERHGIIPLKIEAFQEGTVAFPYEPVIQVTTAEGFGVLGPWIESKILQVWSSIERVTTLKWWHEYLKERCTKVHPSWSPEQVEFATSIMMHDFGDRAGSCAQESEVLGLAHVLVSPGTDTVAGAYQYWKNSGEKSWPCSIHALAHHTVMGFEHEGECHRTLYELGRKTGITAHVSDTYNFEDTVDRLINKVTNDPDWSKDSNLIVLRPDSGDPVQCIQHICRTCDKYGQFTMSDGLKVAKRIRWIQGDSMDWETIIKILNACLDMGYSPFGIGAFGIGGHLRNSISRDHTGLSMKLASVGIHNRATVKRSGTSAKSSIPGRVQVYDNKRNDQATVFSTNEAWDTGFLVTYYDGIHESSLQRAFSWPVLLTPAEIRDNIRHDFFNRVQPTQVLSAPLLQLREQLFKEAQF